MSTLDIELFSLEKGREMLERMLSGQTLGAEMAMSVKSQEALYYMAYTAYSQAKYTEALPMFAWLLTADHTDRRYFTGFAACLQMQKRYREALQNYVVASLLDLTDPEPVMRCAECHLALGERAQARVALDDALTQARAHEHHRRHVPRLEAMLAFLDQDDARQQTASTPAASSAQTSLHQENLK